MKKLLYTIMTICLIFLVGCSGNNNNHIVYPNKLIKTYLSPFEINNLDNTGIRIEGKMEYDFPTGIFNFHQSWRTDYNFDIYYNPSQQTYMDFYFLCFRSKPEQRDQTYTYDSWISNDDNVTEKRCVERFCDFTTLSGDDTEKIFNEKTENLINLPYFVLPNYGEIQVSDDSALIVVSLYNFIKNESDFIDQFLRVYEPYVGKVSNEQYASNKARVLIFVSQINETTVKYSLFSDYYYYDESHLYRFQYTLTLSLRDTSKDFEEANDISYVISADESIDNIDCVYPDNFDVTVKLPSTENNFLAFKLSSNAYYFEIRNPNYGSEYECVWYDSDMNQVDISNIKEEGVYYIKIIVIDDSPPDVILHISPLIF